MESTNRNTRTTSSDVVLVLLLLTLNEINTFFNVVVSLNIILIAEVKRVDTFEFWLNRMRYSENKKKKKEKNSWKSVKYFQKILVQIFILFSTSVWSDNYTKEWTPSQILFMHFIYFLETRLSDCFWLK